MLFNSTNVPLNDLVSQRYYDKNQKKRSVSCSKQYWFLYKRRDYEIKFRCGVNAFQVAAP
jgi:hypothetical protein